MLSSFMRQLRLKRGLSREKVAAAAGLAVEQVEMLESGYGADRLPLCQIYSLLSSLEIDDEEFARFSLLVEAAIRTGRVKSS